MTPPYRNCYPGGMDDTRMCRCCGGPSPFYLVPLCPYCLSLTFTKLEEVLSCPQKNGTQRPERFTISATSNGLPNRSRSRNGYNLGY